MNLAFYKISNPFWGEHPLSMACHARLLGIGEKTSSTTEQPVNTSSGAGSTALQKDKNANVVASGAIGVGAGGKYQEAGSVGGNEALSNFANTATTLGSGTGSTVNVTTDTGVESSISALQTALTNAQDQINSQSNSLQTALTNVTPTPGAIPQTSDDATTGEGWWTTFTNWLAGYGLSATEVSVGLAAIALGVLFLIFKPRKK